MFRMSLAINSHYTILLATTPSHDEVKYNTYTLMNSVFRQAVSQPVKPGFCDVTRKASSFVTVDTRSHSNTGCDVTHKPTSIRNHGNVISMGTMETPVVTTLTL